MKIGRTLLWISFAWALVTPVFAASTATPTSAPTQTGTTVVTVDDQLSTFYNNCMGGKSPQTDPVRSKYCDCVHDGMKTWDANTLKAVADQELSTPAKPAPQLDALARACYAKVR